MLAQFSFRLVVDGLFIALGRLYPHWEVELLSVRKGIAIFKADDAVFGIARSGSDWRIERAGKDDIVLHYPRLDFARPLPIWYGQLPMQLMEDLVAARVLPPWERFPEAPPSIESLLAGDDGEPCRTEVERGIKRKPRETVDAV